MPAIESVIQMRKNRQVGAMRLKRLQRGGGQIILPDRLRKEVARVKAEVIPNTNQTPWRLVARFGTGHEAREYGKRQSDSRSLKKPTAV